MLCVSGVTVARDGRTIVEDISFEVRAGEALWLRGPNGCGKSTLLQAIAGHLRMERGAATVDGQPVAGIPAWRREEILPFVAQDPVLQLDSLVIDNLVDTLPLGASLASWMTVTRGAARQRVARDVEGLAEPLGLTPTLFEPARNLSQGQRRMLALVRSLRIRSAPRCLLLDEPFAGLREDRARIVAGLVRTRLESGWAVVVVEHQEIARELGNVRTYAMQTA